MSADVLENVLEYSTDYTKALASCPESLRNIVSCDICNSLMNDPYTLPCGHSFCGKCLKLWTQERGKEATCPTCRAPIKAAPCKSLGLRQLAHTIAKSYNADPQTKEKVDESLFNPQEDIEFFPKNAFATPNYDSEDDVYRCPYCSHEVEDDGHCSGCRAYFASHNTYDEDHDSDYDEDRSVFDVGLESTYGFGPPLREVLARRIEREGRPAAADSDSDFSERHLQLDSDLGSFIDDEASEGSEPVDPMHSDDSEHLFAEDDENDDGDAYDYDDDKDEEEAMETSDDSLLEETRNQAESRQAGGHRAGLRRSGGGRARRTAGSSNFQSTSFETASQGNGSDVEVTSVRHRPIVIDSDDDDDDLD